MPRTEIAMNGKISLSMFELLLDVAIRLLSKTYFILFEKGEEQIGLTNLIAE